MAFTLGAKSLLGKPEFRATVIVDIQLKQKQLIAEANLHISDGLQLLAVHREKTSGLAARFPLSVEPAANANTRVTSLPSG